MAAVDAADADPMVVQDEDDEATIRMRTTSAVPARIQRFVSRGRLEMHATLL
eukprot:CAMPEP_0168743310 /NCGR_PEP_ID=MMETSP0724-20121128/13507_1 /TAXON_ID=265536 /ORGANISM="Amphiprora sp., Strain CCMP467" /LENGTH=51 /DNA_ID=CAMNT_0008790929 /DNA_START=560 /DNA_END=715 /DNA_ORIENTATION=+